MFNIYVYVCICLYLHVVTHMQMRMRRMLREGLIRSSIVLTCQDEHDLLIKCAEVRL